MIEALVVELAHVGLSLNTSKTKIFSTAALGAPTFIDVAGGMVEVLTGRDVHKYLGRQISGDPKLKSNIEFSSTVAGS